MELSASICDVCVTQACHDAMRLQPLPSRKDFQSKNQTPYCIALASCDLSLHGNISSPRIRFKLWPAAMAAMKTMKAMKVMKKRSSGVHRDRAAFKKSLKRTEKKFFRDSKCWQKSLWRSWKRIMAGEYEQTIFVLKQRLATEVLAEFDFIFIGQLFPRAPSDNQSLDICILRQRPELYSGRFGSGGRAPRWKNELYVYTIYLYMASGCARQS